MYIVENGHDNINQKATVLSGTTSVKMGSHFDFWCANTADHREECLSCDRLNDCGRLTMSMVFFPVD